LTYLLLYTGENAPEVKKVVSRSEVGMIGLARGLLELFRENVQSDLGDVELQKVERALVKFSLTVLDAYRDILDGNIDLLVEDD